MYNRNHFIYKLYDGKNFFEVDNMKTSISNKANNSFKYDDRLWQMQLGIYYLTD